MTNRTRSAYAVRLAALFAAATLLLGVLPAHAATSVEIEARPLLGGRYEAGGWLAVSVTLTNDGAPTDGYLAVDLPGGGVRRFVDMPAGARKAVTLYVRPENFARSVRIRYETPEGATQTEVEARALERSSRQVAIVGDGGGNMRPQIVGADVLDLPEPLALGPADVPERPEPLQGIASLVWAGDGTALTEAQRRSVERWVAAGGQLVVIGGPDWQSRTAAFVDLLPVEDLGATDEVDLAALAAWAGADDAPTSTATIAGGALRADAVSLVTSEGGVPMLTMVNRGAGRVVYVGVDLAADAFRAWEGGPSLWTRLLPSDALVEQFFGPGFPIEEEAANSMSQALSNLPSLEVPPAELLLVVIVGYILLIGPVSYLVLRRMDRRELAWITAPALVVIFTACSYGIGATLKGGDVILNQITLVRSAAGGTAASVETYAGLFSPTRDSYDLTVEADALLASMRTPAFEQPAPPASTAVSEQGDPTHLRGLAVGVFGFQAVRADAVVAHEPDLQVAWRIGDDIVVGTVTNVGDEAFEDVAIVASGGGEMVGDLEPGATDEFELSLRNFNGSSASDQVYGFGGFGGFDGTMDPEQRQVLVRRQVIESLVGFGGFFGGGDMGFGLGMNRGPFIIGWRGDEGPMPITVDDQTVQRYAQTVEVVSGRPSLGPGGVQLHAAQLASDIVSTDGDASTNQPGFVTLGEGEVVFAISLPLEASGLEPSSLRIIVGSDPGMVFQDPGFGFGGFLPQGYVVSIRDLRTGEWTGLGDLSQESSFEIDDPASVMSETGRIEVRVVGTEVDPNFGQTSIFVGAEVEGVIGQ
ncbi:MAG: DUF7408 domain-containing protein [Candidatus Limnocylindria bacterium]